MQKKTLWISISLSLIILISSVSILLSLRNRPSDTDGIDTIKTRTLDVEGRVTDLSNQSDTITDQNQRVGTGLDQLGREISADAAEHVTTVRTIGEDAERTTGSIQSHLERTERNIERVRRIEDRLSELERLLQEKGVNYNNTENSTDY